ncbi:TcC31.2 [Trypanosoma grayi]|uniref:TcC31.2 n=1 Tax=Trypanosoma grayi TaxID=71804 RepID=UPI0004F45E11|nr:TcC31.2 [Trypanosoma grayi]KEG08023.1 TcC31.2 [Trypanosoma grayi]
MFGAPTFGSSWMAEQKPLASSSSIRYHASLPNEYIGGSVPGHSPFFALGGDTAAAAAVGGGGLAVHEGRPRVMAATVDAVGEPNPQGRHADGTATGMESTEAVALASLAAPNATLQGCFNALSLYMGASHVRPEEKTAISCLMEAVTHYTQARLRVKQYLEEGEACMQQFVHLRGSISAAVSGLATSLPNCMTDSFCSPPSQGPAGSSFASAHMQRGRAKVDADLAECRRLLQQVEAFTRTFQDLQRRRARLFEHLDEGQQQHNCNQQQQQQQYYHSSDAAAGCAMAPISQFQATLDECVMRVREQWDASVATVIKKLVSKLARNPQDAEDIPGNTDEEPIDDSRIITGLLQLCDDTLGRVETMRSRITRLGTSRIEEVEAIEKLLATMDNYDPTAEDHAGRRKQIDAELEELRSWLGHIGQLRQRAMTTMEMLQQSLVKGCVSAATSGRASPCLSFHGDTGSALSSHRPSVATPGSLDEWRQALAPQDAVVARSTTTLPPSNLQLTITPTAATAAAAGGDGGGTATEQNDSNCNDDAGARNAVGYPRVEPSPPSATIARKSNSNSPGEKTGEWRSAAPLSPYDVDHCDHSGSDRAASTPDSSGENDDDDDDDDDDRTSSYHVNAFDAGEDEKYVRRRKRGGYLSSIAAFAKAVVERATRFSDTEDAYESDSVERNRRRPRRRME